MGLGGGDSICSQSSYPGGRHGRPMEAEVRDKAWDPYTKAGTPPPPAPAVVNRHHSGEQTPQKTHFLGTVCAFIFAELPPTLETLTFFSLDLFNLK